MDRTVEGDHLRSTLVGCGHRTPSARRTGPRVPPAALHRWSPLRRRLRCGQRPPAATVAGVAAAILSVAVRRLGQRLDRRRPGRRCRPHRQADPRRAGGPPRRRGGLPRGRRRLRLALPATRCASWCPPPGRRRIGAELRRRPEVDSAEPAALRVLLRRAPGGGHDRRTGRAVASAGGDRGECAARCGGALRQYGAGCRRGRGDGRPGPAAAGRPATLPGDHRDVGLPGRGAAAGQRPPRRHGGGRPAGRGSGAGRARRPDQRPQRPAPGLPAHPARGRPLSWPGS